MIRKGWTTAGLGDVMNAEVQREAMRLVVSRQLALDAGGEGTEEDGSSAADAVEVQEEDDDDEYVEEDEEEIDVDVCLAACVEERPVVGERRSARLQAGSSERRVDIWLSCCRSRPSNRRATRMIDCTVCQGD